MDLCLALGISYQSLTRTMTEREFGAWQTYAAKRMLPQRRIELYLAQIAYHIDRALGGARDRSISDYLFDPISAAEEVTAEDEAAYFGFAPSRKD